MRSPKFPRARAGLALAAVALLAVTACSSSGSKSGGTSTGSGATSSGSGAASGGSTQQAEIAKAEAAVKSYYSAPTKILQTAALPSQPPRGKLVVALGQTSPTDVEVRAAFAEAASALGWTVKTISYNPANPATVQAGFEQALALKPDMVTIGGIPPALWGTKTLSEYQAKKIPIIATSTAPVPLSKYVLGVPAGCDSQNQAGSVLANWFISDSKAQGQVLLESVPAYPILACFKAGFTKTVKDGCSGCHIQDLPVTISQVTSGGVPPAAVSALRANPKLTYLLFDAADFATGISSALSAAGLSKIKVGGYLRLS